MNQLSRIAVVLLCLLVWTQHARAEDDEEWMPTPPRLAYVDGEVSYWRPGADEWARARPNLALAEGDALYAGEASNLEVQFGSRSFARADEDTQLSLVAHEPRRIQFSVTNGRVSFDLRSIEVGDVLEVSTPNAVFVIEQAGYYRVEVDARNTHFITRRGGEASLVTTDGRTLGIYPSEEIVVSAGTPVKVATYAAPPTDAWDRWNDARSDRYGESVSARYLPSDVYGAEELDNHGYWRVVPTYGAVWIPYGVSASWAPYSTGYWVWDAYYEWTWIDEAPWGWAPFHYGRWVYLDGYWAWAPGPIVRRAVYAPALVAFMIRDGHVSTRLRVGSPGLWWVALSWGEPVIPWWGPPRHRGHAWWGGWGGPRIVNNVVITQTTVINIVNIRYRNAEHPRSVVTVPRDRFGREPVRATVENRYRHTDFAPVRGELPVKPTRTSLAGGAPKGAQPPREVVTRPVVSTRAPRERKLPEPAPAPRGTARTAPDANFVIPPERPRQDRRALPRPPLGDDAGPERAPPPPRPRYQELRRAAPAAERTPARDEARERDAARDAVRRGVTPPDARERRAAPERAPAGEERRAAPSVRDTAPDRPDASPPPREPPRDASEPRERRATPERAPAPPRAPTVERRDAAPPAVERREATTRERALQRGDAAPPTVRERAPAGRIDAPPGRQEGARVEGRDAVRERPLPGEPASRVFRGRERDGR